MLDVQRLPRWVGRACLASAIVCTAAGVSAEVIDRLMAVVLNQPILMSDVNAARLFEFVRPEPNAPDPVAAVLDRLIDRTLMLTEVDRYQPPEPAPQEIDVRVAQIEKRFASPAALDKALAETGMTRDRLRQYIRDDLRIVTYLNQRFGAAAVPSDEDILAYYREHQAEFMSAGKPLPYEAAADVIRIRLGQVRREAQIRDWLQSLRRRGDIRVLYIGNSPGQQVPRSLMQ